MNHKKTADEALQRLIEGNQRYLQGEPDSGGDACTTLAENITTHVNRNPQEEAD